MLHVGVVSLGEAGNLGDDLIVIALVKALAESGEVSRVSILSHGERLDWKRLDGRLSLDIEISRKELPLDLPFSRTVERVYSDCDLIVVGGGGLLQDVHNPYRPYQWLRYISGGIPSVGVGLGVGPLRPVWLAQLRRTGSPWDAGFVRDEVSQSLLADCGWEVARSSDFVDGEFLSQLLKGPGDTPQRVLGVALRAWPGLVPSEVAEWADCLARTYNVDLVRFFVLEARGGQGVDVDFTMSVRDQMESPGELCVYNPVDLIDFMEAMRGCVAAISMKLHSSAAWSAFGVPVFPISYAPKTAALFGVPFRGLETIREPLVVSGDWTAGRRSHDVLIELVRDRARDQLSRNAVALPRGFRWKMQILALLWVIRRRLGSALRAVGGMSE